MTGGAGGRRGPGPEARRASWLEPVVLLGLAVLLLVDARSYPEPLVRGAPGPAFFPRAIALLISLCGIALLARAWRARRTRGGGATEAVEAPCARDARAVADATAADRLRPLAALASIAAFLALLPRVGTVLLLPPLIAVLMWLMGERRPRILALVPLGFTAFVALVFVRLLGVALPTRLF